MKNLKMKNLNLAVLAAGMLFTVAAISGAALAQIADPCAGASCVVPGNGNGTANLPANCDYLTGEDFVLTGGLPVGTTIRMAGTLTDFQNIIINAGGVFGPTGEIQQFQAMLNLVVSGTGKLAIFNRLLFVPVDVTIHTEDRIENDPVQSIQAELRLLAGSLFGDPDFDQLNILAGSAVALPSPGYVVLTDLGGGNFNVDSFFDIEYRIDFSGQPGSIIADYSGTTFGATTLQQGADVHCPCPSDINLDSEVNVFDLLQLLGDWGECEAPCPPSCDSDITLDCAVDIFDLLQLLSDWGLCFPV